MHTLFLIAALIGASVETTQNTAATLGMGTKLSAVACNAAAASRWTGWVQVNQQAAITLDITLVDADADETSIDMRCESSRVSSTVADAGRDIVVLTSTSAAGVTTSVQSTWRQTSTTGGTPITDGGLWTWTVGNIPAPFIECLFTCNGSAEAADTLTVFVRGITP
jgi:hypothetical protein